MVGKVRQRREAGLERVMSTVTSQVEQIRDYVRAQGRSAAVAWPTMAGYLRRIEKAAREAAEVLERQ